MGDEAQRRGGDDVTTRVSGAAAESTTDDATAADMRALLAQAEAEAAEAEAAAAAARARVTELRSGTDEEEEFDDLAVEETPRRKTRLRRRLSRPRWPVVARAVVALVIVASLAGSGYILWRHHDASARNQRAADFAAAASEGITAMTSLDFRHAKEDVQAIIDRSTGSFRDDYEVRAGDFVKVVESSKVVARGTVTATAVQSMSDHEAVVLVAATEEITNAAGNKQPRLYRFRVTVTRDGEELKMSRVEFVP